ncbi:MAG: hypothetical protein AMXMBFR58_23470 [Phycisphaerae bacterium]
MTLLADDIMGWCVRALREVSCALDAEQQPKGLDSFDEKKLQQVLAEGIAGASGLVVLREQHFPTIRRTGARFSQRERCDLVILPAGARELAAPAPEGTAQERETALWSSPAERERGAAAGEAYWVEVKVVGQVEYRRGVPVPNVQYSTQLIDALCKDLQKMADDPLIEHGAVLDVVFCSEASVAEHDMAVAIGRCMDRGLVPGSVRHEDFMLADRVGNRVCSVWLTTK